MAYLAAAWKLFGYSPPVTRSAIPVIAAFLTDRSLPHWSVPGASSAPTKLVELLPRLGPDARKLVPALRGSLDHPNRWDYVPTVVNRPEQFGPFKRAYMAKIRVSRGSQGEGAPGPRTAAFATP